MNEEKSPFTKAWIIEHGVPIVQSYGGNITLRALHYQLVARGGAWVSALRTRVSR